MKIVAAQGFALGFLFRARPFKWQDVVGHGAECVKAEVDSVPQPVIEQGGPCSAAKDDVSAVRNALHPAQSPTRGLWSGQKVR
jgi:hypothetical protein